MVLFEMWRLYFLFEETDIFSSGPHKVHSLQMHQFLLDVFDFLDQVDIVFIEFGLSIDNGYDSRSLGIEHQSLHFGDLCEDGVEVVLSDG